MKNVINKSFEIKDYMIDGTDINGFWMNLEGREKLTTEIVYAPVNNKVFEPLKTEKMIQKIIAKCDSFKSQLPENINCEVIFKDFDNSKYSANDANLSFDPKELSEIRVVYKLSVSYHI